MARNHLKRFVNFTYILSSNPTQIKFPLLITTRSKLLVSVRHPKQLLTPKRGVNNNFIQLPTNLLNEANGVDEPISTRRT